MTSMLSRRHQLRHRLARAASASRLPAAGKTGTTNDYGTRGSSATRRSSSPASGSASTSRGPSSPTATPAKSPCRCGRVHEGGDEGRQARVVHAAEGLVGVDGLPHVRQAPRRGLRGRGGRRRQRGMSAARWSTRSISSRQGSRRSCPLHPGARLLRRRGRLCSARTTRRRPRRRRRRCPRSRRRRARPSRPPPSAHPADEAPASRPRTPKKKKRGFWSRLFGKGEDEDKQKPPGETSTPK